MTQQARRSAQTDSCPRAAPLGVKHHGLDSLQVYLDFCCVVVEDRASHDHDSDQTGCGPGEPGETPTATHHHVIFQQGNAAENVKLRVGANVLEVLERAVASFPCSRKCDPNGQPDTKTCTD